MTIQPPPPHLQSWKLKLTLILWSRKPQAEKVMGSGLGWGTDRRGKERLQRGHCLFRAFRAPAGVRVTPVHGTKPQHTRGRGTTSEKQQTHRTEARGRSQEKTPLEQLTHGGFTHRSSSRGMGGRFLPSGFQVDPATQLPLCPHVPSAAKMKWASFWMGDPPSSLGKK